MSPHPAEHGSLGHARQLLRGVSTRLLLPRAPDVGPGLRATVWPANVERRFRRLSRPNPKTPGSQPWSFEGTAHQAQCPCLSAADGGEKSRPGGQTQSSSTPLSSALLLWLPSPVQYDECEGE